MEIVNHLRSFRYLRSIIHYADESLYLARAYLSEIIIRTCEIIIRTVY